MASKKIPLIIFAIAFVFRIGTRLIRGREDLLKIGYLQYIELGRNLANTGIFAISTDLGLKFAFWPPIYPYFEAIFFQGDQTYLTFVVASAIVGSLTVLMTYLIGRELFNELTGVLAGSYAAVYPYFVLHDVSVQDTALFTCMAAVSIWFLAQTQKKDKYLLCALSGIFLALTALTRASITPYFYLIFPWLLIRHGGKALIVIAACFLTMAPWLMRNYQTIGVPTLTSQTGRFLWIAHNPSTFTAFPQRSMDDSEEIAWTQVHEDERAVINSMSEVGQNNYFWKKGKDFIFADPLLAIKQGVDKIWIAFSWTLSPRSKGLKQTVYFVTYLPILAVGLFGMILALRRWKDVLIIYLLFLSFMIGTAIFWGHTSHRAFLDIYFMIFAASVASWLWARWNARSEAGSFVESPQD